MSTEEEIEARRAARKAALVEQRKAQRVRDLEALDALEVEHGDENVASVDTARYVPGCPTLVVVRVPTSAEFKRMRDTMMKGQRGQQGDPVKATEQLGSVVMLYPEGEQRKALLDAFPGMLSQAGAKAATLAAASAEERGND